MRRWARAIERLALLDESSAQSLAKSAKTGLGKLQMRTIDRCSPQLVGTPLRRQREEPRVCGHPTVQNCWLAAIRMALMERDVLFGSQEIISSLDSALKGLQLAPFPEVVRQAKGALAATAALATAALVRALAQCLLDAAGAGEYHWARFASWERSNHLVVTWAVDFLLGQAMASCLEMTPTCCQNSTLRVVFQVALLNKKDNDSEEFAGAH